MIPVLRSARNNYQLDGPKFASESSATQFSVTKPFDCKHTAVMLIVVEGRYIRRRKGRAFRTLYGGQKALRIGGKT